MLTRSTALTFLPGRATQQVELCTALSSADKTTLANSLASPYEPPCEPADPLLAARARETEADVLTQMSTASLVVILKKWKQPNVHGQVNGLKETWIPEKGMNRRYRQNLECFKIIMLTERH